MASEESFLSTWGHRVLASEEPFLSNGSIAVSAFNVYRNAFLGAQGDRSIDWDDLDDDQQAAWLSMAEHALNVLDSCEDLPWMMFAAMLFSAWARRIDYPVEEFSDLSVPVRAAWVAVARHVANLCALDAGEDLVEHEEQWIGAANTLGHVLGVS